MVGIQRTVSKCVFVWERVVSFLAVQVPTLAIHIRYKALIETSSGRNSEGSTTFSMPNVFTSASIWN